MYVAIVYYDNHIQEIKLKNVNLNLAIYEVLKFIEKYTSNGHNCPFLMQLKYDEFESYFDIGMNELHLFATQKGSNSKWTIERKY